ncbi:hypothetical protein EVAR_70528_1 [Eumeta japonica]|uniref:GPR180/TMEM145 transmembrane domain-containing protein n=1 Tax=Eumeta variegata TaxID=151549 RepID=A0A4C2ABB7_EUMVA|nr:hypothetical protein EVAR_70528_1 [Eumeta japonica]
MTCTWHHYKGETKNNKTPVVPQKIHYDFWLVNGNPNLTFYNSLLYQFSFDRQNTLELYLIFWLCYIVLLPVQIYAVRIQKHPVTRLFTSSLLLEFIALCFNVLHTVKYAADGVGFPGLAAIGDVLDIMSRTEVDIIEEIDEYQTWPGWLILALRVIIMAWFVLELRNTMMYEHNMAKLNFLLHFGASSLVWFVYLPVIALIVLQISPLWRFKFLLGITYSADCLAFCVMAHLLWPTRSEQYLLLTPSNYTAGIEELDEFNESPHVVHSDTQALTANEQQPEEEEVLFTRTRNGHVLW